MLFLLLLIVVLCYAAWMYIQMYALFVIGAAVVLFTLVYIIGKCVAETKTGQKFGETVRSGLAWCFKTPLRIMLSIFVLAAAVVVVFICYDSGQPQAYDIDVEYHNWEIIEEGILGESTEDKYAYLVTNNGDQPAYVKIEVTQYGEYDDIVETDTLGANIPAGKSRLLEFDAEEDGERVSYKIVEVKKPKYTFLEIGYTEDSEVYFCYDEEDTLIVVNKSGEKIEACGAQIVYYDADGEIIAECTAAMGDLQPNTKDEDRFYPNYIPEEYDHYEICEWAYVE